MTKKAQIKRYLLEAVHTTPYAEIPTKERAVFLGTLLLALDMIYVRTGYSTFPQKKYKYYYTDGDIVFQKHSETDIVIGWRTRNKQLKESTLDDQDEETIDLLYSLLFE